MCMKKSLLKVNYNYFKGRFFIDRKRPENKALIQYYILLVIKLLGTSWNK